VTKSGKICSIISGNADLLCSLSYCGPEKKKRKYNKRRRGAKGKRNIKDNRKMEIQSGSGRRFMVGMELFWQKREKGMVGLFGPRRSPHPDRRDKETEMKRYYAGRVKRPAL